MRIFWTTLVTFVLGIFGKLFYDRKKAQKKVIEYKMKADLKELEKSSKKIKAIKQRAEKRRRNVDEAFKEYMRKYPNDFSKPKSGGSRAD